MVCDRGNGVVVRDGAFGIFDRGVSGGCVCRAGWVGGSWIYGFLWVIGVRVYNLAEPAEVAEVAGWV